MQKFRILPAVAAASALLAGCEWSGSSDSASWSSAYDNMNFSGTYRSSSTATSESSSISTSDESGTTTTHSETSNYSVGDTEFTKSWGGSFSKLSGATLVNSSVTIDFSGDYTETFVSDESGTLTGSKGGTGKISGTGWNVTMSPGLIGSGKVNVKYQVVGTGSSTIVDTTTSATTTHVTAITVSQNGQNLVMRFNNGIQMDGKFTAINQTSGEDAAVATYNAQFEVKSGNASKFVGTLNYDVASGYRTLNGTWTWGKGTYDIHGIGPSYR